jgi:hypothetical protein
MKHSRSYYVTKDVLDPTTGEVLIIRGTKLRRPRRKNRRSRYTDHGQDIMLVGLLFMLALLHSVVFNGFA